MEGKYTAIVLGATGLIGKYLVKMLLEDPDYNKVIILVRRPVSYQSEKAEVVITDFSNPESYAHYIKGDHFFCCIGTTIKKAGSKEEFRAVDFTIPVKMASLASSNGVSKFLVISSLGGNSDSGNFYLKTKGEMEAMIRKNHFRHIAILRPSLLLGDRDEVRTGESVAKYFMSFFKPFFLGSLKRFRPVHAESVARAMKILAKGDYNKQVFESDEIEQLGKYFPPDK
ncbi:MAG: NAD(P)H-binding protein [Cytophagaceae bacterium]